MKFKLDVMRRAALAGVALLAVSCGGGTQIEAFVPARVIAFGDEASFINTDNTQSKYTVNGVLFDTTVSPVVPLPGPQFDCTANQIWVQQLAYSYGLAFTGRCPGIGTNANGKMFAAFGAKVADLATQVDTFLASDGFGEHDLVTVMVGTNDIIDAFENQANPTAAAQQAGTAVGAQVVRITDRGAKVLVATVPDVGLTPYAYKKELLTPGSMAALSALSAQFNTKLRLKLNEVRNGGRSVGLVLADDLVLTMVRNPAAFGLTNITEGACTTAPVPATLPSCNAAQNVPADIAPALPTYGNAWLWADDTHLGPVAHGRIGLIAIGRARGNPF